MGLITNLIGNIATAKNQEEMQKTKYNQGLAEVLGTIIKNPSMDAKTQFQAAGYLTNLVNTHGGKQGKAMAQQISQFLSQSILHQKLTKLQSQSQPEEDFNPPGGVAAGASPFTSLQSLAAMAPQAEQAPARPQGRLQRLAGAVGGAAKEFGGAAKGPLKAIGGGLEELSGVGRNVTKDYPSLYDKSLFEQDPESAAIYQGKLKGEQDSAAELEKVRQIQRYFTDPTTRAQLRAQGYKDTDIDRMAEEAQQKALGITPMKTSRQPIVVEGPGGQRETWEFEPSTGTYYDRQGNDVGQGLPEGWNAVGKLGTAKSASIMDTMAPALRKPYQENYVLLKNQYTDADGNWTNGWDEERAKKQALLQASAQGLRTEAVRGLTLEQKYNLTTMQADEAGIKAPAPWTAVGANFDALVMGTPQTRRPIPEKGQPITDPVASAAMDEYFAMAMKLEPTYSARDPYKQVRLDYGRNLWVSRLGSIEAVDAAFKLRPPEAKALGMTVQREAGVKTLSDQLDAFAGLLEEVKARTLQTGVPLIDKYLNNTWRELGGEDAELVGRLDTALNAVGRIYSQLLSNNAYVSVAMPHVGTEAQAADTLKGYMTSGTLDAIVDQMKREAAADAFVYAKREFEQFQQLATPIAPPQAPIAPPDKPGGANVVAPPAADAGQPGDMIYNPKTHKLEPAPVKPPVKK